MTKPKTKRISKKTKMERAIEVLEYGANNPDVFYDSKTVKAVLEMLKRIDKYYD